MSADQHAELRALACAYLALLDAEAALYSRLYALADEAGGPYLPEYDKEPYGPAAGTFEDAAWKVTAGLGDGPDQFPHEDARTALRAFLARLTPPT